MQYKQHNIGYSECIVVQGDLLNYTFHKQTLLTILTSPSKCMITAHQMDWQFEFKGHKQRVSDMSGPVAA